METVTFTLVKTERDLFKMHKTECRKGKETEWRSGEKVAFLRSPFDPHQFLEKKRDEQMESDRLWSTRGTKTGSIINNNG